MTRYKNKFAEYKTMREKLPRYQQAIAQGALAYKSDGTTVPLSSCSPSQVEFVAGLWRVQNPFPYEIQVVRDREVVLMKKLPHKERIPFEYYLAFSIGENCYGRFLNEQFGTIVAKYETDDGVYWGYGATIEQARAFLGIKLFDQYMDLIHSVACKKIKNTNEK